MFLHGTADFQNKSAVLRKFSGLLLLVLGAMVMQSCATNFTTTSQTPGRVLAIKSLGFRETSSKITLKGIDPYTVGVTRNICSTELLSVERQALTETKYGTQTFDCKDAYTEYLAHNITALGMPLLYDSVTGFRRLKEKCAKKPPLYRTVVTESNDILSEESYDSNTTVCKAVPVPNVSLTAKINDTVIPLTTSAEGIASLPPEKIAQLELASANAFITFKYEDSELTTRHLRKKPEYPLLFSTAAMNYPEDYEAVQGDELPPDQVSDPETALEQSFVAALAPPQSVPLATPTVFQGGSQAVPVAKRAGSDQTVVTKAASAGAWEKSSAPVFPSAETVSATPGDKLAEESKTSPDADKIAAAGTPSPAPGASADNPAAESKAVPVPEKTAAAETTPPAKAAPVGAGDKSSLAALPAATAGPRHPREIILFYDPYAPAPESIAADEKPLMAKADQRAAMKKGIQKTATAGAAAPKAGKTLRDEIKNAAPPTARQKTHPPAMAGAKARREELKAEILLQQLFILNPALSGICCPLTDKLFWKIRN